MNKGITGKGKLWEWGKSWWLIAAAVSFLGWISFVYMGVKTKTKKWTIEGIIYCAALHLMVAFSDKPTVSDFFMGIGMLSWIVSIVRVFMVRKEYLLRREYSDSIRSTSDDNLKRKIQAEYSASAIGKHDTNAAQVINTFAKTQPQTMNESAIQNRENNVSAASDRGQASSNVINEKNISVTQTSNIEIVDINHCSENDLASLPGVSVAMAKKAIFHRDETGGFDNLDEFYAYLELKPHIISQLNDRLKCGSTMKNNARQSGRILVYHKINI